LGLAIGVVITKALIARSDRFEILQEKTEIQIDTKKKKKGEELFFADRDTEGLLRINLRYIDTFLRWGCGKTLLNMGLFPNAKDIREMNPKP